MSRSNFFFIVLCCFLISSCKEKETKDAADYSGFLEKEISLIGIDKNDHEIDTLGKLAIMLPSRLDTFYKWQHFSDCKTCGEIKYRCADNRYDQYAESGFFWSVVPDSIYQFTVWHEPYRPIPDSLIFPFVQQEDTSIHFNRLPSMLTALEDVEYKKREFRQINNRNFVIVGFETKAGYLTQSRTEYLVAVTNLKSRLIYFIAECGAKDCKGFAEDFYKAILSIRIFEK